MFRLHRWLARQAFLGAIWRFLSGWHHDGRPGRGRRAGIRCGVTAAAVLFVAMWSEFPLVTGRAIVCLLFVFLSLGCWWLWRRVRQWKHHRTWLRPAHLAAHELAGIDRRRPPRQWITAELDEAGAVCKAVLKLPQGWPPDEQDKRRLALIAGTKLGIENAQPSWRLAGPAPLLTLTHSPPPPGHVHLADVLSEMARCRDDELLIGVGKDGELVRVSLGTDSPHIALSMGTGAGKSNLAGFLLLQMLIRGSIGQILDAKRRLSYPWLLKDMDRRLAPVPNVAYAWTTAQIHASMVWMGKTELDRRGDVAFAGMDTRGQVHANVGARLFTIAEELNLAVPKLKEHWAENRQGDEPRKSPAFTGLAAGAFAGRQVNQHLVLVGQMLTAEVTGSRDSSVRGQCGVKLMARYEAAGWKIMCGDIPMPPPPTALGRIQVVTASGCREAQVPELDPVAAREMVLAGVCSPLPHDMPCRPVPGGNAVVIPGPGQGTVLGPGPVVPALGSVRVILSEAVEQGIVSCSLAAVRKASQRDRAFPPVTGYRGVAGEYDALALAGWDAGRR